MPRQARLNVPGVFYHVIVRGIERRRIFRNSSDYRDFLKRLGTGLANTGSRCFAWALMSNHVHLLLLNGARELAALMQPLLTGYAVTFNVKYERAGHLFQNRYKAILCQEDPYFLELVRYIALQPVAAGLVKTPQDLANYPWTSHQAMMGGFRYPWQEVEEVLGHFGSSAHEARPSYERFVMDRWTQGRRPDLEGGGLLRSVGGMANALALRGTGEFQEADARILGDGAFVETILAQAEAQENASKAIQRTWSPEALEQAIADFSGVEAGTLTSRYRGRAVSSARALLIFAAKEWLGITGTVIARRLQLSSGSIAKAYAKGRLLAQERRLFDYLQRKSADSHAAQGQK